MCVCLSACLFGRLSIPRLLTLELYETSSKMAAFQRGLDVSFLSFTSELRVVWD